MLKKRLNNKKGFTLAELLIAVAIIGILVAISVPVFTGKLADAKKATDDANMRAAKAAAVVKSLEGDFVSTQTYYYDAAAGKIVAEEPEAYGQENSGEIITITFTADGEATVEWAAPSAKTSGL